MPWARLKPCPRPGCPNLVHRKERYCDHHRKVEAQAWDSMRGTSTQRGYGVQHRRWRDIVLANDRYCRIGVKCNGEALSTVADHIVPLQHGGNFAIPNGQGACEACHNWKRAVLDRTRLNILQVLSEQKKARRENFPEGEGGKISY